MALLWMEGFDDLESTTTNLLTGLEGRWSGWAMDSSVVIQAGTRTGFGKEIYANSAAANIVFYAPISRIAAGNTLIVGMAVRIDNLTQGTGLGESGRTFFSLYNSVSTYHGQLYWINGGTIGWTLDVNGYNDAPVWTTTNVKLTEGVWHYLEVKILLNSTTGSISVRVDGGTEETGTSLNNTRASSVFDIQRIQFFEGQTNHRMTSEAAFDDIYVADDSGTINNDWLGSVEVVTVFPTSDGTVTQWTPSTGVDNYALLDEIPASDTDYIEASASTTRDLYGHGATTGSSVIHGIMPSIRCENVRAGIGTVELLVKGSAESSSGTVPLGQGKMLRSHIFETHPDTTAKFTDLNFTSVEVGVEVT